MRLLTIPEAAEQLGVGQAGLARVAKEHGFLIVIGRDRRIDADELGELLERCRCPPKVPASSCERERDERPSTPSRTRVNPNAAPARATAERLKSLSRNTSPKKTGQVVPLARTK